MIKSRVNEAEEDLVSFVGGWVNPLVYTVDFYPERIWVLVEFITSSVDLQQHAVVYEAEVTAVLSWIL